MATRGTRSSVGKQVGDSKTNDKANDVPEVKKENCRNSDSVSDIELKKPTGRARTRKTTESIEDGSRERNLLHAKSSRFRSASLPPVSREPSSPKAQRKLRTVKVCQTQNGVKNHVSPYRTRSDTPLHILRSGKQRSSIGGGWVFDDAQTPLEYRLGRRRTTSSAKDKIPDDDTISLNSVNLNSKVNSPAGAESDVSRCNSPIPEIKPSVSDLDNDIKMPGLCSSDIKSEDGFFQETRSEGDPSEISGDSNLGKTISNKISALLKRGHVSQILQQISRAREERRVQAAESEVRKESGDKKKVRDSNSNLCNLPEPSGSVGSASGQFVITPDHKNPISRELLNIDIARPSTSKAKETVPLKDVFAPASFYKKSEGIAFKSAGKLSLVNSVRELSGTLKKSSNISPSKAVNGESKRRMSLSRVSTSSASSTSSVPSTASTKRLSPEIEEALQETFEDVLQRLEQCVTEDSKGADKQTTKPGRSSRKGSMLGSEKETNPSEEVEKKDSSVSPTISSKTIKKEPKKETKESVNAVSESNNLLDESVSVKNEDVKKEDGSSSNVPIKDFSNEEPTIESTNTESESGDLLDDSKIKVRRSVRSSAQKATALISAGTNKPKSKPQSPPCIDDNSGAAESEKKVPTDSVMVDKTVSSPAKKTGGDSELSTIAKNVIRKEPEIEQSVLEKQKSVDKNISDGANSSVGEVIRTPKKLESVTKETDLRNGETDEEKKEVLGNDREQEKKILENEKKSIEETDEINKKNEREETVVNEINQEQEKRLEKDESQNEQKTPKKDIKERNEKDMDSMQNKETEEDEKRKAEETDQEQKTEEENEVTKQKEKEKCNEIKEEQSTSTAKEEEKMDEVERNLKNKEISSESKGAEEDKKILEEDQKKVTRSSGQSLDEKSNLKTEDTQKIQKKELGEVKNDYNKNIEGKEVSTDEKEVIKDITKEKEEIVEDKKVENDEKKTENVVRKVAPKVDSVKVNEEDNKDKMKDKLDVKEAVEGKDDDERKEEEERKIELRKRKREETENEDVKTGQKEKEFVKKCKAENDDHPQIDVSEKSLKNLNASTSSEDTKTTSETVVNNTDDTSKPPVLSSEEKSQGTLIEKDAEKTCDKIVEVVDEKMKNDSVSSPRPCGQLDLVEDELKNGVQKLSSREQGIQESKKSTPEEDSASLKNPEIDTSEKNAIGVNLPCEDHVEKKSDTGSSADSEEIPESGINRKRKLSENAEDSMPSKMCNNSSLEIDSGVSELPRAIEIEKDDRVLPEKDELLGKVNIVSDILEESYNGEVKQEPKSRPVCAEGDAVCFDMESPDEQSPSDFNREGNVSHHPDDMNVDNEPEFVEFDKIQENGTFIPDEKLVSKLSESPASSDKPSDDESEALIVDVMDSEDSSKESLDTRADSKGGMSEGDVDELLPKAELKEKVFSEDGNDFEMMEKEEDDMGEELDVKPVDEEMQICKTEELSLEKAHSSSGVSTDEQLSPEDSAIKEPFLSALGLGPRSKVLDSREHGYTGTLKTVIKVHRSPEKKGSKFRFMVKNRSNGAQNGYEEQEKDREEPSGLEAEKVEYRIHRDAANLDPAASELTNFGLGNQLSTNSPFLKENAPDTENVDKSTTGSKDDAKAHSNKAGENLVIPEKSSSFSIHPGRLCSDVCSYCFGKFGSLDTPCHIAQLKNVERQQKILQAETHLTADSCLCDACYRHVDRKANCPSYNPQGGRKRIQRVASTSHTLCCSTGCSQPAVHQVRRKWMVKLKRCIGKKVPVDMEKAALHQPFPLCSQHYFWVEHYMQCGLCKRRLSLSHMYMLGPEVHQLNHALANVSVPCSLSEKIFVCKLCRYFCQLCLKYQDQQTLTSSNRLFCENYRKKILYQNEIEISDSDDKSENFLPPKSKRRKTKSAPSTSDGEGKSEKDKGDKDSSASNIPPVVTLDCGDGSNSTDSADYNRAGASTPTIDYSSLAYPGTSLDILSTPTPVLTASSSSSAAAAATKQQQKAPRIRVKVGNTTLDPSTEIRPVFSPPAETQGGALDQIQMHTSFDFRSSYVPGSRKRKGDWEICQATIQFTKETKRDFMNLQRPYGNYSSFIRHMVLLEKFWREGDLVLSPSAKNRAASYISSIENRIKALEGPTRSQTMVQAPPAPYVPPALPIVTPSVSVLPLPPLIPVTPQPVALSLPPPPVAVIDLPMRRPSATTTTTASVKPITISTVPVSVNSSSSTSTSGSPSVSGAQLVSKPSARNKPLPNIIQVTTSSGKTYPVYKAYSLQQVKALHQQRKQQALRQPQFKTQPQQTQPLAKAVSISQTQTSASSVSVGKSNNDCIPLIGDVWSLAPDKATSMWEKPEINIISEKKNLTPVPSNRQPQTSMSQPKVSVTIVPKSASSKPVGRTSHLVNIAPKPVAVMTSSGIILSRNSEISVSSVSVRRDDSSKC